MLATIQKTEVMAKSRHQASHLLDNYHNIQLPIIADADDDLQDNHPYPLLITDNHLDPIELGDDLGIDQSGKQEPSCKISLIIFSSCV